MTGLNQLLGWASFFGLFALMLYIALGIRPRRKKSLSEIFEDEEEAGSPIPPSSKRKRRVPFIQD